MHHLVIRDISNIRYISAMNHFCLKKNKPHTSHIIDLPTFCINDVELDLGHRYKYHKMNVEGKEFIRSLRIKAWMWLKPLRILHDKAYRMNIDLVVSVCVHQSLVVMIALIKEIKLFGVVAVHNKAIRVSLCPCKATRTANMITVLNLFFFYEMIG